MTVSSDCLLRRRLTSFLTIKLSIFVGTILPCPFLTCVLHSYLGSRLSNEVSCVLDLDVERRPFAYIVLVLTGCVMVLILCLRLVSVRSHVSSPSFFGVPPALLTNTGRAMGNQVSRYRWRIRDQYGRWKIEGS